MRIGAGACVGACGVEDPGVCEAGAEGESGEVEAGGAGDGACASAFGSLPLSTRLTVHTNSAAPKSFLHKGLGAKLERRAITQRTH